MAQVAAALEPMELPKQQVALAVRASSSSPMLLLESRLS
jgi:hypothetical protein